MSFLKAVEFKVGALVLGVIGLIAVMSMRVSEDPNILGRNRTAWFVMGNAAGLIKGSGIKTAGIPVGTIQSITLQDGLARVDLSLKSDLNLKTSAVVEIRSVGILGDKYIEVSPGNPNDPPLPDGGQIFNVKDQGSLDNLITQVSDITGSLKSVAKTIKESIEEDGTREHVIGRIVLNIEKVTSDLAQMTGENKEQIGEIVDQVHSITSSLDELVSDSSDQGFKKTWKRSMSRIDNSLKNIEEITDKVNRGEGTIGKLISDEKTAEDVSQAIEGISTFVDSANRIQTGIDFNTQYLGEIGEYKSTVGIRIQPGLDRYYQLQVVDDPLGVKETTDTKLTTGGSTTESTEVKTFRNKIKFTLLYAKNFHNLTVKGGLIENTGGLGVDYQFFKKKLKFTVEAFDFSNVNLRASLQYSFFKGLYLSGGVHDALNKSDSQSAFVGVGLFLTNDDLKILASKVPL